MADPKRTLMSNVGRAMVKKLAVKFKGNDLLGVDDLDVIACYQDLWKTESTLETIFKVIVFSVQ